MARFPYSFCCSLLLLSLLVGPGLVSASLPHNNYLFLVDKHRRLAADADSQPKGACSGKTAGDLIEGQYIVVFDTAKVSTVSDGVSVVRQTLQQQVAVPTAAFAPGQSISRPDPFVLLNTLTTVPEDKLVASSTGGTRSSRRRRVRMWGPGTPYLGAVIKVPPGAVGDAVVQSINDTSVVETVVPDACVKAMLTQERFTCLPATMLSSSIQQPASTAVWDGCLTSNTYLAWYGERCGNNFTQVLWAGVFAFDKTTGARLPNCVKQRPASGGAGDAQVAFWLGACGAAPGAVPALPGRVCRDPYISDTLIPAEEQGCMNYNFTEAAQTLELFHPVSGCGTAGQPVSMTYKGQRCNSNSGGILWQTAVPAAGSGLDASRCSLQRRMGTSADDLIFNMDWFGSCGVPPARVQYIPRSECPAPPPPPPPSPSPRPEDQKALDREPLMAGETRTPGIMRILGMTNNGSNSWDTVKVMQPVTVAVMDSGVDCFHRDLNVVYNKSFMVPGVAGYVESDSRGCADVFDHGTNVAGIIGAKNNGVGVVGVLPNVAIASLKILNSDGAGSASGILDASNWLLSITDLDGTVENPDNLTNARLLGVDVINMSFGTAAFTPYDATGRQMCDGMTRLLAAGIVPVAAAGNEQTTMNNMLPAACQGVIAVTALDQKDGTIDNTNDAATRFTNFLNTDPGASAPATPFKANMTVSAPGESIYSTCYQQRNAYCIRSGTSQATPHVSGQMARCFSGRRCESGGNGTASVFYAVNKWMEYNQLNLNYGYVKDPIRGNPRSIFYYGYLTVADVW